MNFFKIVAKNFKLLLRSKSSAFMLLLGPILIIALVGFFFSGKTTYDLSIGYYASEKSDLTRDFVDSLKKSDYVVYSFESEESCVGKIKDGIIHTCVIFPKNFEVKNAKDNEVRFIVDYSRINLVYKVIDSVSEIIDSESNEVSYSLTNVLLSNINETVIDLGSFDSSIDVVKESEKRLSEHLSEAGLMISSLEFDSAIVNSNASWHSLEISEASYIFFRQEAYDLYSFAERIHDDLDGYIDSNLSDELKATLDSFNKSLSKYSNNTDIGFLSMKNSLEQLDKSLNEVNLQLETNQQLSADAQKKLSDASSISDSIMSDLDNLKSDISDSKFRLDNIGVKRAETIVSPVNTKIEPLVADASTLEFTFPFLVILIIMFASIMIASTLVLFEKNSRALFRNFLVPVSEKLFVLASFSTVIIITLLQAIVILLIGQLGVKVGLFSNFVTVFFILLVASVFFTVCGMLIGYLFSSQEGAVMAALVLGCSFLFISNLVVPLETIAPSLYAIIQFNPFIIFSELLRKALLFSMPLSECVLSLGILLWLSLSVLLAVLAGKGFFTRHKMRKREEKNV